ncbi:MAG: hypothetical protein EXX96DRAFT_582382 [Benjaminiella poitrasii]|nr:MAG: hypothetical protein EXX96DRAFT_582382 [Benjaminiella poitrasii]
MNKNDATKDNSCSTSSLFPMTTLMEEEHLIHPTEYAHYACTFPASSTCFTMANSLEAFSIANQDVPFDFFNISSTDQEKPLKREEDDGVKLPHGWKMADDRKRSSIFELDTNIQTLSELYSALIDLRNQLPEPVAKEVEQPFCSTDKPMLSTARSSSSCFTEDSVQSPRPSLSILQRSPTSALPSPTSPYNESGGTRCYERLETTYPSFIFELLIDLYHDCISYKRAPSHDLNRRSREGYRSAIYAYSALHALICHPERFGLYSFMYPLAQDAYRVAFELVEFDAMDATTIETLVVMSQYLSVSGHEGEARNLFCLARRQIALLLTSRASDENVHRLFVWMTELDWSSTLWLTAHPTSSIHYSDLKASLESLTSHDEDQLTIKAAKFRIKGLHILLSAPMNASPPKRRPHHRLNQWRSKYLETFLYKRQSTAEYTLEDRLALRLHALYFASMVLVHQRQMLVGFDQDQRRWESLVSQSWSEQDDPIKHGNDMVERGLYRSMNAAYGFIQVIQLLLDEKDRCILPQVNNTTFFGK